MQPFHLTSIAQYHKFRGLTGPAHPLISVVRVEQIAALRDDEPEGIVQDFYSIALKKHTNLSMGYGQGEYAFGEGKLLFIAPKQVYSLIGRGEVAHAGWVLLVHPDFFWNTPLAATIQEYEYFGYSIDEALYLSEREEATLIHIFEDISEETHRNVDAGFKPVVVSQIELLLNYADRYYRRQFITREKAHHRVLGRMEQLLSARFTDNLLARDGLPTVTEVAAALHVSPNYLSTLLRELTGRTTQQHLHDRLIEKAKEKLSTEDASVAEVAYALGFEYSQSFSKFFKARTQLTPSAFRQSFR